MHVHYMYACTHVHEDAPIGVRPSIFYPLFLLLILFRLFAAAWRVRVRDTVTRGRCAALRAARPNSPRAYSSAMLLFSCTYAFVPFTCCCTCFVVCELRKCLHNLCVDLLFRLLLLLSLCCQFAPQLLQHLLLLLELLFPRLLILVIWTIWSLLHLNRH